MRIGASCGSSPRVATTEVSRGSPWSHSASRAALGRGCPCPRRSAPQLLRRGDGFLRLGEDAEEAAVAHHRDESATEPTALFIDRDSFAPTAVDRTTHPCSMPQAEVVEKPRFAEDLVGHRRAALPVCRRYDARMPASQVPAP